MGLVILEGGLGFDRSRLEREFDFEEWLGLSDEEKRYVYKHIWNPMRPDIGASTRAEILERFKSSLDIPEEDIERIQYSYFGACVGAIHIVLTKRGYKVPSHFAWLPVNKGIMINGQIKWRWTL